MTAVGCRFIIVVKGASSDVIFTFDEEPMCRQTTVDVSSQARQNGSQCSEWKLGTSNPRNGLPSLGGFSENDTARTPRAALR